ncbi:MAG: hypothetical protein R6U22_11420 [Desulfohalobiaceae bacterium]
MFDHAYTFDTSLALRKLNCNSNDRVILCDEDLSGNFHSGGLHGGWTKEVAQRLAATFPNARIVIFIREQKSLLSSIYQQYIREGGTHKPYRYFHPYVFLPRRGFQPSKVALFSFEHFRYPYLIRLYQNLFGSENVFVFLYEDFRTNYNQFIKLFRSKLNLDIEESAISWEHQNISYQRYALALARFINHFTWRDVVDKRYWFPVPGLYMYSHKWIQSTNKRLPLGGYLNYESLFNSGLIKKINQIYRDDNRWIMEHFDLPLDKHGYAL